MAAKATSCTKCVTASKASSATSATYSSTSNYAKTSGSAGSATNATNASTANYAKSAGGISSASAINCASLYATGNIKTDKNFIAGSHAILQSGSTSSLVRLCGSEIQCNNQNITANTVIYASAFTVPSSKRYKENINDLSLNEALKILDLNPVTYDYIVKENGIGCVGLIAEDVVNILKYPVIYNQEGEVNGIDYSKFIPYIIRVLQYQQELIEESKK